MKKFLFLSFLIFAISFSVIAEGKPTIAIMEVSATNTSEVKSQVIYEYIVDVVNRRNIYTIVERSALQAAIKEMEISASGMIDDSTAAEIGKLAGAEFILIYDEEKDLLSSLVDATKEILTGLYLKWVRRET